MADLISHPFRIASTGRVAVVAEGSDAQLSEQLAIAVLTNPGERELVPQFGLNDPTFGELDAALLGTHLAMFGPDVDIVSVTSQYVSATAAHVVIEYDAGSNT